MDGLSRAAGVGPTIEFGGKSYQARGRTIGYYASMEAEICRRRGDPVQLFVNAAVALRKEDGKPDVELIEAMSRAVAQSFRNWRNATWQDYSEFIGSVYGQAFEIWWALNDSELSIELVQGLILESIRQNGMSAREWLDAAQDAVNQASGDMGNLIGHRPTPSPAA